ncbi:MAG: OmpA family protein [Gammaproteobacteria bacterium]|nr:OmpA family protein [Gammaproteobacteria bacterium]
MKTLLAGLALGIATLVPAAIADAATDTGGNGDKPAGIGMGTLIGGLHELARGVAFTVYFRTNSAAVSGDTAARIQLMGEFLRQYPELRIYLDAHSDRRGSNAHNRRLSRARADTVAGLLLQSGIPPERIRGNAWGEIQAHAPADDPEELFFERRVDVQLGLDPEA